MQGRESAAVSKRVSCDSLGSAKKGGRWWFGRRCEVLNVDDGGTRAKDGARRPGEWIVRRDAAAWESGVVCVVKVWTWWTTHCDGQLASERPRGNGQWS